MPKVILIAEDEKPLAMALDMKLKSEGFNTAIVSDGLQAFEAIKSTDYDLALIDLVMPKLDGFGLLKQIKALGKPLKIMVLSNLSQQEDIERVRALGVNAFYIKSDTPIIKIVEQVKALTI